MDESIFKAYDVRGVFPTQLDEDAGYRIGRAVAASLGVPRVAVGRDMRLSSPALARALVSGLTEGGTGVVDLGLASTDQLYYAVGRFGYPAGVMVTASHNPPEYNGFKLCRAGAVPISSETGLREIAASAVAGRFPRSASTGVVTGRDVLDDYAAHVLSFADPVRMQRLKVVVDAGNGMAGLTVPPVFRGLPCDLIPLFFEPDGRFPNHPANPLEPENVADLQRAVRAHGADLGAAFDGDADRVFLVDEAGARLDGSTTTALVAQSLLAKVPGATVLYNLICSRSVPEFVARAGGRAVRTRVGHSFIKQVMREENAVFGGEHSGHFYFRDNWYADSGLIALVAVLDLLGRDTRPLSALVRDVDTRVRSGEINSRVPDVCGTLAALEQRYADGEIDHLDGLTVSYPDWWFNVRPSNTEPLLRLNVEADDLRVMETKRDDVLAVIRSRAPQSSPSPRTSHVPPVA
jgi:phosphomannomutase